LEKQTGSAHGIAELKLPFNLFLGQRLFRITLWLSCATSAFTASEFQAIPPAEQAKYHIDFARHFFATPAALTDARKQLDQTLNELETLKGKVGSSAATLRRALQLQDRALIQENKLYRYFYLRYAVNTKDVTSLNQADEINSSFNRRTAFLQTEIMRINPAKLSAFLTDKQAGLEPYRYAIAEAQRYASHQMALPEEEMLGTLNPSVTGWQQELFDAAIARAQFEPVNGLDPRAKKSVLATDPDRAVRKSAWENRARGFEKERDLFAFALAHSVKAQDRVAQLHHFGDAPSAVYFRSALKEADVKHLLNEVSAQSEVLREYQKLRREHTAKRLGISDPEPWDDDAPSAGATVPRFTIEEATGIARAALAPLGKEFSNELAQLLDPSNGRMEIVPGANRKSGGFSQGFVGTQSVFFSGGFEGSYNDVLVHEATHAVHRQLMSNSGILPVYAEGPHYLFEAFAIFSELLFTDYLVNSETDPRRRAYFLEQYFAGKGMELFYGAQDSALEQNIYDAVKAGTVTDADGLDRLSAKVMQPFSIWPDDVAHFHQRWIVASLMYEDPLYYHNYLYAALAASKFYELYRRDPRAFTPKYMAMMREGFDVPAADLLRRHLGIDIGASGSVPDAVARIKEKLDLLQKTYAQTVAQ
jgi:oligoendopeptidase F